MSVLSQSSAIQPTTSPPQHEQLVPADDLARVRSRVHFSIEWELYPV